MEKVLEGDLARFEVPEVLSFLNTGRRTGVLVMEHPQGETKLFFRDGNPVFATSTNDELRFGTMLVRLGRVPQESLDRALDLLKAGGHRLGQILLAEKILTEAELASFLKVQVSEVIFETFRWGAGIFTFWDRVSPPATAVTLEMDLQSLLMEGVRRNGDRAAAEASLPDRELALEALTNPDRVKHSATLTPEEWQVFFLVDGRRTISEICRLAGGEDEGASLQIVRNLVAARFVTVVSPPAGPVFTAREKEPPPPRATQKVKSVEGHLAAPPAESGQVSGAGVSVEFVSGLRAPKQEDDTKEIVSAKAVQYVAKGSQVTLIRLILMREGNETSFPLTRDAYTLGRHRNNDIVINDPKVSSFHARLDRTAEGFVLVDLQSRNGCFVNQKRVQKQALGTGDEVRLGTARLVYKVDYSAPLA